MQKFCMEIYDEYEDPAGCLQMIQVAMKARSGSGELAAWGRTEQSDNPTLLTILGEILCCRHEFSLARECFRKALKAHPDFLPAEMKLMEVDFMLGDLAAGFSRMSFYLNALTPHWFRQFRTLLPELREWQGEIFSGKKLLVVAVGGFGDKILFARFLHRIKARGGTVSLMVGKSLAGLLATVSGVDEVLADATFGEVKARGFHYFLRLPEAPAIFGISQRTVPQDGAYITADVELVRQWQRRLPTAGLKVGLVWAGSGYGDVSDQRSIPLCQMMPLLALPGVQYISLQVGPAAREKDALSVKMLDAADSFNSFTDTAAVVSQLDLIISVDTAMVHLAGALGRPVWALLPYLSSWQWPAKGEHSPWYPSARLFRQSEQADWTTVVRALHHELSLYSRGKYSIIKA
ncbi:MAG TPA: glycosyltransferase family 9 protein [Patescibacteria group bacterium]|nr:glycosyltransferase family 9 protein [Patescibacteria group bacterium]